MSYNHIHTVYSVPALLYSHNPSLFFKVQGKHSSVWLTCEQLAQFLRGLIFAGVIIVFPQTSHREKVYDIICSTT